MYVVLPNRNSENSQKDGEKDATQRKHHDGLENRGSLRRGVIRAHVYDHRVVLDVFGST
jgi:hypothetical protein